MNNEKIAIITDSCSDVPLECCEKYDIKILPMIVLENNKEYKDGLEITSEEVYVKQKKTVLKTACPKGEDVINLFQELKETGYTHAIIITLASRLSGTYNAIRNYISMEEDLTIELIDGRSGSIGYGSVVETLAEYNDGSHNFIDVLNYGKKLVNDTFVYFSIDTLIHLKRGGRISATTAIVGDALHIKPILTFSREDGEIIVKSKVRGSNKVINKLMAIIDELMQQNENRKYNLIVANGGNKEGQEILEKLITEKYVNYNKILTTKIGACLSCYLGSGLLGCGVQFID